MKSDHPDIDVLCDDREEFLSVARSESRGGKNDKIHRKVSINGKEVALDIRHVGDGYYDTNWELEMLKNKRLHKGMCYVMDDTNYYYSLLYHVLIQKNRISDDYYSRLEMMAKKTGNSITEPLSVDTLQIYMKLHQYKFTYPLFSGGIANFSKVDKDMIERNYVRQTRRILFKCRKGLLKFVRNILLK